MRLCCCCSVVSCVWLCKPTDYSTPVCPVPHHPLELAQTHVRWINDAIHPSHPLSSPSPPVFNLSQHQGLSYLFFPWATRRSNRSILKEISSEYLLEGLMLKLKLQYFCHLMLKTDSLEKTLMLGKAGGEGDDRGWDGWMASAIQWTWVWVSSGSWWWTGRPGTLQSMWSQRVVMTERLNWIPTFRSASMS